jgi:putative hydrolase of the HAD superfamily
VDGAAALLGALAPRYRIGVATNATVSDGSSIQRALARVGLDAFVSDIFCFRELGVRKSDPRFWEEVGARLARPRSQLLMVGDDLENDVLAPRRAGIATVWFNRERAAAPPGVTTVERLEQLLPLVLQMI